MKYGKGTITTVYDSVNFYRDVYDDPNVTFKREGDKITLISGDGTIINDKLIAKSEDAFNHKFDTYTPSKKQLNDNQQLVLEWLKKSCNTDDYTTPMLAIYKLYSSQQMAPPTVCLSKEEQFQVLAAFADYGLECEE